MSNIITNKVSLQDLLDRQNRLKNNSPIKPIHHAYEFTNQNRNKLDTIIEENCSSSKEVIPTKKSDKQQMDDSDMIISRNIGTNTDNLTVVIPLLKQDITISITNEKLSSKQKLELEYIEAYLTCRESIDIMNEIVKKYNNLEQSQ